MVQLHLYLVSSPDTTSRLKQSMWSAAPITTQVEVKDSAWWSIVTTSNRLSLILSVNNTNMHDMSTCFAVTHACENSTTAAIGEALSFSSLYRHQRFSWQNMILINDWRSWQNDVYIYNEMNTCWYILPIVQVSICLTISWIARLRLCRWRKGRACETSLVNDMNSV